MSDELKDLPRYVSTGEAARIIKCAPRTIVQMCKRRDIVWHCLPGSKTRRVDTGSLLAAMLEVGADVAGLLQDAGYRQPAQDANTTH